MDKRKEILNKNRLMTIYMYLYIFLVIFLCRDSLISTTVLGFKKSFFMTIIVSIPCFIICIRKIKIEGIKNSRVYLFLILVLSIILSIIIKSDYQLYNFSLLVFIFIGFTVSYAFEYKKFAKVFINIMLCICIYSLITTYLLKMIIIQTGIDFPTIVNSVNNTFYNFIFSFALTAETYIRNFSFFREPGVYQVFIIIALILLLYRKNNEFNNKRKIVYTILFIISLISTFSTTGIILLVMLIITYIVKLIEEKKMNKKVFMIILSLLIISILILILLYNTIPSFKNTLKFSIEKIFSENESLEARQESIIKPLQLYLTNPILGHKYIDVVQITPHNTNTTINMFAIYGILAGVIHLILIYLFVKKIEQPKRVTILIFIVLIVSINTQFLIGDVALWIVMFSSFMNDKEILKKSEENNYEKEDTLDS